MIIKNQILAFVGMVIILALAIFIATTIYNKNQQEQPKDPPSTEDGNTDNKVYWGVDSASYTDDNLYQCVQDNFGQADVWGRYLGDKEGVSAGLDSDEVSFLHENDVRILVIYNHLTEATGYDQGVEEANKAISYADELDIPEGVAIFSDIEPDYPVDSAFMEGWYDTLAPSVYEAALYGVFNEDSSILEAFNATNQETRDNTIIWTAYPQLEITTKENAPEFKPQGPNNSLLYGWQYAIDAEDCNIDTNLFSGKIMDYLW